MAETLPFPPEEVSILSEYLTTHWRTPEQYVLDILINYAVVLLGEDHAVRHNLTLAHRLIPLLYQAGVYNFGMEFGASEDQTELDRLVMGERYDEDIARRLMFNYNSGWAYREYMTIYRTAWQLNRSLPVEARKFRIINLSYKYNWSDAPVVRTPANAHKIYPQGPVDAYRANLVEREIIDRGEKIVILTGTTHAFTRYREPFYDFNAKDFVRFEYRNLGQLLFQYAPTQVFTILLHRPFHSQWNGEAELVLPAGGAIDQVMAVFTNTRVGFDLVGTPFGDLPDESYYATGYEDFRMSMLADGYIYDRPLTEYDGCTVDEAFLNEANWPEAQRQLPDPQWHTRPASLEEYMQQIRDYADIRKRYHLPK